MVVATAAASSYVFAGPSLPGRMGTPAFFAVSRATALSPMSRMASGVGPMNVRPHSRAISANAAFSARKP